MIDLRNTWIERTREVERYIYNRHGLACGSSGFFYFNDLRIPYLGYFEKDKQNKKQIHLVNGKFEYVEEKLTDEQKEELEQLGINKNSEGVSGDVTSDDLVGLQTRKKDCQFAKKGKENGNNVFRDNTSDSVDSSRGNQNNSEVACPFAKYGFKKPDFECEIFKEDDGVLFGIVFVEFYERYVMCEWDKTGNVISNYKIEKDFFKLTLIRKEWWEDENYRDKAISAKDSGVVIGVFSEFKNGLIYDVNNNPIANIFNSRPATKEEVLKLVIEEK